MTYLNAWPIRVHGVGDGVEQERFAVASAQLGHSSLNDDSLERTLGDLCAAERVKWNWRVGCDKSVRLTVRDVRRVRMV